MCACLAVFNVALGVLGAACVAVAAGVVVSACVGTAASSASAAMDAAAKDNERDVLIVVPYGDNTANVFISPPLLLRRGGWGRGWGWF